MFDFGIAKNIIRIIRSVIVVSLTLLFCACAKENVDEKWQQDTSDSESFLSLTEYIEPEVVDNRVTISFRNVPKEPIRISTDELTERFVRGDTSRHSEGHGLGLSIVYDLMELMGGKLILSANSVMFEAKLSFEKVEKEEINNN